MAYMNVVHMRVKPGMEEEYLRIHRERLEMSAMKGIRSFRIVACGERHHIVIGEWESRDALVAARPAMIANLDRIRPLLEDLGGGRGVTEPWSGEVVAAL